MEITEHSLWTIIHGMGFGAVYLLACSGAIVELPGAQVVLPPVSDCAADGARQSDRVPCASAALEAIAQYLAQRCQARFSSRARRS
jgi:hypothetical protein